MATGAGPPRGCRTEPRRAQPEPQPQPQPQPQRARRSARLGPAIGAHLALEQRRLLSCRSGTRRLITSISDRAGICEICEW
ncbi:unnamed protein product, partial [Coccothraustes coccothraustes]